MAFQELMLDEYKLKNKQLSKQIEMQLRTHLFDGENLFNLQNEFGSDCLTTVYFLLFGRIDADQK